MTAITSTGSRSFADAPLPVLLPTALSAFLLFTARRQRAFDLAAKTIVIRAVGRRTQKPWALVVLLWTVVVSLATLTALIARALST